MNILQLTAHFKPNLGGVETHLDDLVKALIKRGWKVVVLTYRPLTTNVNWKIYESNPNLEIFRLPWIPYLFYKLVSHPILEFLYLLPGLFLVTPIVIVFANSDIIHAHGLVAGFVGVFWGKIFNKRVVLSTHSIYNFPNKGLYISVVKWIFNNASFCLGLSRQSCEEIKSLGIKDNKVDSFTYWIDLEKFRKIINAKKMLGWEGKFVVLFVGRLVVEKGVLELLKAVQIWNKQSLLLANARKKNITLVIIGTGPLEDRIKNQELRIKNVEYLGKTENDKLPNYYSAADLVIVPSIHEEGFGRVIIESLACGIPVIGANRGAIPEALDETVGMLIDVTPENIKTKLEYFYKNPDKLKKLAKNARSFAERRYSEKNVETIIEAYTG